MTELEITPEPPLEPPVLPVTPPVPVVPRPVKSPLGPILVGFFTVIVLSALLGFLYFKAKFQADMVASSPTPSPSSSPLVSPSPTLTPSPESTGSPKPSVKASVKPSTTPKATTPTPVNTPTLDVRFGNPSANIKQTIDEGNGDGRVINREYTSIQVGSFDEVPSSWSPKITACFHIVVSENIAGKDLKFKLTVDDKSEVEDNLGQYDKLEAGRTYDWCHDVTTVIGKHTARLTLNHDKSL